ncbi:tetratricopeptide repeat protein [Stenomitos frigidus]|uniref:Tetratricopeptide repeat protein n=1 Tax=Stenomitos frigidus ULC18 TaxID=2107698 RepID=A0A2T1E9X1_9CYAN|nr:tetratricopeptide repeat protein [Stenomitos frigidus]PSB29552.1 hypothetical protein C7B82_11050 [Stenomitos frigidus ULC18]
MPVAKFFSKATVRQPDRVPNAEMMAIFSEILAKRLHPHPHLIDSALLPQMILKSGGVLRELIRIVDLCCDKCMQQIRRQLRQSQFDHPAVVIDVLQQSLEIDREIGDRNGEADSLFNRAIDLNKLGRSWEALQHYQKAKKIYQSLGLEHRVKMCDAAIYQLNQIIPAQHPAHEHIPPALPDWYVKSLPTPPRSTSQSRRSSQSLWVYGLVGVTITLLLFWLKR